MKKIVLILFLFMLLTIMWPLVSQSSTDNTKTDAPFLIMINPAMTVPIGESSQLVNLGGSASLTLEYNFTKIRNLFAGVEAAYSLSTLNADAYLSVFSAGLMVGWEFPITNTFSARIFGDGGYYHALVRFPGEDRNDGSLYAGGGAGIRYDISPVFGVGLDCKVTFAVSLMNTFSVSLGATFRLGVAKRQPKVQFKTIDFPDIYPVLYKYYDDHPAGQAILTTDEKFPVTNIAVSVFIKQFMDSPKSTELIPSLESGVDKEVDLYALLNDNVQTVTEATKVAADIIVDYQYRGKQYTQQTTHTIRVLDRNAMRWDDDRKAAAFVTARDPYVLKLSKAVAGLVRQKGYPLIDENLRITMGMHEALAIHGLNYVVDPKTPYNEFSQQQLTVDYLQFPRQTLEYKGGDCDDLSILYCALLESVGIETAFITIPGHIFMAFALKGKPQVIQRGFSRPEDLISIHDKLWIPIEITERYEGFLSAWQTGAKQWREQDSKGQAGFHLLHDAWSVYEPVGLPGDGAVPAAIQMEELDVAYENELIKFINREIYSQVAQINERIRTQGTSAKLQNRLGVLYARYGLNEKALNILSGVIDRYQEFVPSLMNIGNIYFLDKNFEVALEYYERAAAVQPSNPKTLLAIARINHEMENYGSARRAYDKVAQLNPSLAEQFSYLSLTQVESARAADYTAVRNAILWE